MSTDAAVRAVKPKRIQRQRRKGWRMPEGVVYVGRPSKWGNPFALDGWRGAFLAVLSLGERGDARGCRAAAVKLYRLWLTGNWRTVKVDERSALQRELTMKVNAQRPTRREIRAALRGKDLACWCQPDQPCHADVLLEIANA
jgi:hypothetical protein